MKTAVVSYSFTGNNGKLAQNVARKIAADYIPVTEQKERTTGTIMGDLMLGRTPRTEPQTLPNYDLIVFIGPVWCGHVATPLRGYLRLITNNMCRYAFCSISGGAEGANPKLAGELQKLTDREPGAVIDLHIADLMPQNPKPTWKMTSAYKLSMADVEKLADTVVDAIKKI